MRPSGGGGRIETAAVAGDALTRLCDDRWRNAHRPTSPRRKEINGEKEMENFPREQSISKRARARANPDFTENIKFRFISWNVTRAESSLKPVRRSLFARPSKRGRALPALRAQRKWNINKLSPSSLVQTRRIAREASSENATSRRSKIGFRYN